MGPEAGHDDRPVLVVDREAWLAESEPPSAQGIDQGLPLGVYEQGNVALEVDRVCIGWTRGGGTHIKSAT